MSTGKLIVIEGGDGAGKATQTDLVMKRLIEEGRRAETMSFPQYGKPSALNVERYLRKEPGYAGADPMSAATWFARDRQSAVPLIERWISEGAVVVLDRWSPSNMAHQGARVADPEARTEFLRWLEVYEYAALRLPKPDLVIVLSVAPDVRDINVGQKAARDYLQGQARDAHEGDLPYQEKVERMYREIATTLPGHTLIECMDTSGKLMPPETIRAIIWAEVSRVLSRSFA